MTWFVAIAFLITCLIGLAVENLKMKLTIGKVKKLNDNIKEDIEHYVEGKKSLTVFEVDNLKRDLKKKYIDNEHVIEDIMLYKDNECTLKLIYRKSYAIQEVDIRFCKENCVYNEISLIYDD
ncbi:MAG: hypothetical protein N4A76_12085 [Firmicutes bacterium]|jgi:hypothetical protein|nr:hypothetical protein [Bacillota bacterium]